MEEIKAGKKFIVWFVVLMFIICGVVWFFNRSERIVEGGIVKYEQFQEIYNTCAKLNTDLGIVQTTLDSDRQFEQFTKAQRINAIKINLNRWVEDYNAKSKVWTLSMWKSNSLPYQLSVNDFPNYNK